MAQGRKYATLPDLDLAPDIYETPELTEDVSTLQTSTTALSDSQGSVYSDDLDAPIDRRGIPTGDEARTQFDGSRVDARTVDFSDRLARHHKSYRIINRRKRRGSPVSEEAFGDFSDEEDETLERKLARLRREVEEVKIEFENRKDSRKSTFGETGTEPAEGKDGDEDQDGSADDIVTLSKTLDAVYIQRHGGLEGAEAQLARTLRKFSKEDQQRKDTQDGKETAGTSLSTTISPDLRAQMHFSQQQTSQAFAKAADFDARLSELEKALGLNAANMPDMGSQPPKPILQILETLDRQMNTITEVSANSLDAASRRITKVTQEAERLEELRRNARNAQDSAPSPVTQRQRSGTTTTLPNGDNEPQYTEDPERVAKINALYGTLATIDSLAPSLPLVLERLRTLRLVHTSAGNASATLDELEKRQGEQAEEIRQWTQAVSKVETGLQEGGAMLAENVKTVSDWVKELEARVAKFG
ncbi:hypothetical protein K490DRAFT_73202 [Saccharata proteae CBS 121410]|uniref:Dynactin subunit n=1 Tax=Saccharata proteae CBS 121410 TaxID=1314787 RepID=A0A9P4HZU7_9PEZI|nr:hypothetical protein K490DRAFT_73202 [Saccharata proteae CBS 121410]